MSFLGLGLPHGNVACVTPNEAIQPLGLGRMLNFSPHTSRAKLVHFSELDVGSPESTEKLELGLKRVHDVRNLAQVRFEGRASKGEVTVVDRPEKSGVFIVNRR